MKQYAERTDQQDLLLKSAQRLACIFLDRLEQGLQGGSLDNIQMRLLGALAIRSVRLWKEILGPGTAKERTGVSGAVAELSEKLANFKDEGVQT